MPRRAEDDDNLVWDQWVMWAGPAACAHHYLKAGDLGPELAGDGEVIGRLTFIEGPAPHTNDPFVRADDHMTLSCLQERLNRLGEGIEVRGGRGENEPSQPTVAKTEPNWCPHTKICLNIDN